MLDKKDYYPLIHVEEIRAILNTISLFGGLDEKQLHTVCTMLKGAHYQTDEAIFKQGDEPTHLYIVRSGDVRIVVNVDTEPHEIADFCQGACFGEMALIGIHPHSASAIAMSDTEILALSSDALHSIYSVDKELFGKLILNVARDACRRLHRADATLLEYFNKK